MLTNSETSIGQKPASDGQQPLPTAPVDVKMEDTTVKEELESRPNGDNNSHKNTAGSGSKGVPKDGAPAPAFQPPKQFLELESQEPKIPIKKDTTLREFLGKMDDYSPIIPDAVINYYLTLAGLPPPPQTPPHLARLLALATQKFIADIATDAYQYARIRSSNTTSNNPMGGLGAVSAFGQAAGVTGAVPGAAGGAAGLSGKDANQSGKSMNLGVQRPGFGGGGQGGTQGRTVLTMEDLGMAVGEYGVNIKRGEFYR